MREILFRGKRVDNGEWIEGDVQYNVDDVKIREREADINRIAKSYPVFPESVGQYTGLTDENDREIFEGDIVRRGGRIGLVTFCTEDIASCGCCVPAFGGSGFKAIIKESYEGVDMRCCEIIGNIYDNPELLEE